MHAMSRIMIYLIDTGCGCPARCDAGVEKVHGLGELNDYEKAGLKAMLPELIDQIQKGIDFAKKA